MTTCAPVTNEAITRTESRPRFEGSNIGTWIGFKHVMYLAEEAVLEHLRARGHAPGRLRRDHGLGLEIVDSHAQLAQAVEVDDVVELETRDLTGPEDREMSFAVRMAVARDGRRRKAASARVRVQFRREDVASADARPAPTTLGRYVTAEIRRGESDGSGVRSGPSAPPGNAFVWSFQVPYFYCHYTQRLQHSGYVRLLEEAVDRFLADRGISIATMLRTRGWIPVVAEARMEMLREAYMEETLQVVFTVEEVYKARTYTARVDTYVDRQGVRVHTATGRITHAYLAILDRGIGGAIAPLDETVLAALTGARRP